MSKETLFEVEEFEVYEEIHERIDALVNVLEKKGVLKREEIEEELENIYKKKEEED